MSSDSGDDVDRDDSGELVLAGARLSLRRGRSEDGSALRQLFECPGVMRWWGPQSQGEIDELVNGADPEVTVLIIDLGVAAVGLIQFHEEEDPMYRHAGIDLAIHDDYQGQGFGPEAIRLVVDHLGSIGHHRIVIDPNAANRNAIKAYERVGFKAVGTMRDYEWSHTSQTWTDGLLMELLIRDLR